MRVFKYWYRSPSLFLGLLGPVLSLISVLGYAAIDAYDFGGDVEKEKQFKQLIEELRCPKCQNQNIAGSSAPLAKDLKDRVYKLFNEGRSSEEIIQYLVDRYGDFVSYRPPLKPSTWFLWFAPIILFVVALVVIVVRVSRRAKEAAIEPVIVDKKRIDELLKTYSGEAASGGLDGNEPDSRDANPSESKSDAGVGGQSL